MFTFINDIYHLMRMTFHVLRAGRNHLVSEKLAHMNADPNFSLYSTIVFWADYCGIEIIDVERKRSFEAVRMLIYYVRRFDDIVDTPSGIVDFVTQPNTVK